MTNPIPKVSPLSVSKAMPISVSLDSSPWLAGLTTYPIRHRTQFGGLVFFCLLTSSLGTSYGQKLREINCPFIVHQIADATDPNQFLLVGQHKFAELRLGSEGDFKCEALPFQIDDAQIACVCKIDVHRIVVAGAFKHEMGFVAIFKTDGQRLWQQTYDAPLVTLICRNNQAFVGDIRGKIVAIQLEQGMTLWERQLHSKMVTALVGYRDGTTVSADWTGKIVVWNSVDGTEVTNFQQHRDRVSSLIAIDPDDASQRPSLISASRDGTVRLWYPTQNRLVRFIDLRQPVTALAIVSGLRILAATQSGQVQLLDLSNAKSINTLETQLDHITAIRVLGDDLIAISGEGPNRLIKLPK